MKVRNVDFFEKNAVFTFVTFFLEIPYCMGIILDPHVLGLVNNGTIVLVNREKKMLIDCS